MAAGRADAARRPVHRRRRAEADQAVEHRQARSHFEQGRRRGRLRGGRRRSSRAATPPKPVHQAYIEPHACVAQLGADGQATIFSSQPGPVHGPRLCAKLLGWNIANIRVTPAEIGGGFGGKTLVYLEPLALALSRKCGRPVKMVMTREEVFRASGPTSGAVIEVKIGAKKDGTITAAQAGAEVSGRRVPRLAGRSPAACARFACTTSRTSRSSATTWSATARRSRPIAPRARRSRRSRWKARWTNWRASSAWIRSTLREKNARAEGTKTLTARPSRTSASSQTLEAAKHHPHWKAPLGPNQGRGLSPAASGSISAAKSSAAVHVDEDGTRQRWSSGSPDIGGSRASMAMMAAEVLGMPVDKVRPIVADTSLDRLHRMSPAAAASPSPPAWRPPRRPRRWSSN